MARQQDHVKVRIPGFHGPGHYVIHYSWKGYTNCVDVDLFANQVEHKYGVPLSEPIFDRIDHCQFVDVPNIISPIFDATTSPTLVKQYMLTHNPVISYENGIGINVVPLKLPDDVFQPTPAMLPWDKARRSDSESEQIRIAAGAKSLLKLSASGSPGVVELGTPQRSDDDFMEQLKVQRTEKMACLRDVDVGQYLAKEGVQCSESTTACTTDDYRRIIQIYSNIYAQEDTGQTPIFKLRGLTNDDNAPMVSVTTSSTGLHLISYCTTAETKVDDASFILQWEWSTKTDTDRFNSPDVDGSEIKISFHNKDVSLPDGWYGDYGQTFSQKNRYGWSLKALQSEYCQQPMSMEECQQLGASETFETVLDGRINVGDVLLGENLGFGGNTSFYESPKRPTGCYMNKGRLDQSGKLPSGDYYSEGTQYDWVPIEGVYQKTSGIASARACHENCKVVAGCFYWFWNLNYGLCKMSGAGAVLSAVRGYDYRGIGKQRVYSGSKDMSTDTPSVFYNSNDQNTKCSPDYPCLCKAMDGQHYQPVPSYTGPNLAKELPGLSFGWNCDVSANLIPIRDAARKFVHSSLRSVDFTGVSIVEACTTPRTASFGGLLSSNNDDVHFYKTWELELPDGNGEYEITLYHEHWKQSACVLENYALTDTYTQGTKFSWVGNKVVRRFVRDGRLTLTGHTEQCRGFAWMKIRKVSAINRTFVPSMFPSSSNIIWEQEILESGTLVGDSK